MKFVFQPLASSLGCILAHNLADGNGCRLMTKGTLLGCDELKTLECAGITNVYVACLQPDDLGENEAAQLVGAALAGAGVMATRSATGRCNLKANHRGLLCLDVERLHRLNAIDDGLTIATLPDGTFVHERQLVATIKIIPFAISRSAVVQAQALAGNSTPIIAVRPVRCLTVGLIISARGYEHEKVFSQFAPSLRARVEELGAEIVRRDFCLHEIDEIARAICTQINAGCKLILIASMTAIIDRHDVTPRALEAAGGVVEHFGVPMDPGNLLLLGYHGATAIVGVPGCARSRKANALDWLLARLCAGVRVRREDLIRLGHGGLLEEIRERHMPRDRNEIDRQPASTESPS